jgi:hypothetical protein
MGRSSRETRDRKKVERLGGTNNDPDRILVLIFCRFAVGG